VKHLIGAVIELVDALKPADALELCGVDIPDTRNLREPWILGFAGTPNYQKPPTAAEKYNQQYIRGRQLKKKYDAEFAFRYKRRSLRMSQHNYGWSGTYFVTIRTAQREPLLEIPELRTILRETWEALPQRFPGASLDEFVIMPDHIHFILWLEGNVENPAKLGDIVGTYKSITTVAWLRHIQATRMERPGILWQHNYYERVIRDSE